MPTLEESEALLMAINLVGTRPLEADPASFAGTVSVRANCAGGGVVNAGATLIPSETETGFRLLANLTMVPEGCAETANGRTFTLDGAPSLRQTGTYTFSMLEELVFVFDLDVSMVGALASAEFGYLARTPLATVSGLTRNGRSRRSAARSGVARP